MNINMSKQQYQRIRVGKNNLRCYCFRSESNCNNKHNVRSAKDVQIDESNSELLRPLV